MRPAPSLTLLLAALFAAFPVVAAPPDRGFLTERASGDPLEIATGWIAREHGALGLEAADLDEIVLRHRSVSPRTGATRLVLRQRLGGIPVFNGDLTVTVDRDGRLIGLGHRFVRGLARAIDARAPKLSAPEAAGAAAAHLGLSPSAPFAVLEPPRGPARRTLLAGGGISRDPIPARLHYLRRPDGSARLAWTLIVRTLDGRHWWTVHVDAKTGAELAPRGDWIASDDYRVYPPPVESPDHGGRTLESNPADPNNSPFGWHDTDGGAGAEFTTTSGNNVFAEEDGDANDANGFQPDGGPGLVFDFPLDPNMAPGTYESAAIANLYYWNNLLHDVHYHYGFDEDSGNFQENNYGGGGLGGDAIRADARDGAGTNNARFLTPPDGTPGRMEMFIWQETALTIESPPAIAGTLPASRADFGRALTPSGFTRQVVQALDPSDPNGLSTTDGCSPLTNPSAVANKIALIDRGTCLFVTKVRNAQSAGADGVIIANNVLAGIGFMGGTDPNVTIPSLFISLFLGDAIKAELPGVVATPFGWARDSDLDSGIIVHEYGHGVSNRLTGDPNNVNCLDPAQSGAMGEGWSDWWALAFTAEPGDLGPDPRPLATYLFAELPDGNGIRSAPYSTDMAIHGLTFGDLPALAGVHARGEVWASALWRLYWNLVQPYGLDPDLYDGTGGNNLALQLVMDGIRGQACEPTYLDARDAIVAADVIESGGRHHCRIWDAFARRGMGAAANDANDPNLVSVTEDFSLPTGCALCGDVNDDEEVDLIDVAAETRAFAALEPMFAPEKCNTSGATDPADPDGDGIPNDCDGADLQALREELAEASPGVSPLCEPAVGLAP